MHENPLVAISPFARFDTQCVSPFQQSEPYTDGIDCLMKTAANNRLVGQGRTDRLQRTLFEPAVGMQKEKHLARGRIGGRILLTCSTLRNLQADIGFVGTRQRVVIAAAIDDNDLAVITESLRSRVRTMDSGCTSRASTP